MKKLCRHIIILLILILTVFCRAESWADEEVYNPYPIIFVHGLNSSNDMWVNMRDEMRKYFMDGETSHGTEAFKYIGHSFEWDFFPYLNYRDASRGLDNSNNGDIKVVANSVLIDTINSALNSMKISNPSISKENQKVIIVCHSMGGLVTRSLLTQIDDYKEKIYRVVFIDTPHLGSPYASALWLLNERKRKGVLPYAANAVNYSYSAFSSFGMEQMDNADRAIVYARISGSQFAIKSLLDALETRGPHPSGMAVKQLRIPATVLYQATYKGLRDSNAVTITESHTAGETFLGGEFLDKPKNYKTIMGTNEQGMADLLWDVDKLIKFKNNFTFPVLNGESQTIDNAIYPGDGIVTQSSQKGIGNADYLAHGFHAGIADTEECIVETLACIDDKPIVEGDMCVISADRSANTEKYSVYIIPKVKEYFLADVEVSSLTLDGVPIDIPEFGGINLPQKPYYAFGKDMLKKRSDPNLIDKNENPITLYPGEFYFKLKAEGNEPHTVKLKMKNPAGKESEEKIFTFQRPIINSEKPTGTITDNKRPIIEARIHSPLGVNIDSNSIKITLDGTDISHDDHLALTGEGFDVKLKYEPNNDLSNGSHEVIIDARDINGLPAIQKKFTFRVRGNIYIDSETPARVTNNKRPHVGATIHAGAGINLSSITFTLDGQSVDYTCYNVNGIYEVRVYFSPPNDLAIARHTVHISANDLNGEHTAIVWTFKILPRAQLMTYLSAIGSYLGYIAGMEGGPWRGEFRDWVETNAWYPSRAWSYDDVGYKPEYSMNRAGAYYSYNSWGLPWATHGWEEYHYATVRRGSRYVDLTAYAPDPLMIDEATLKILWDDMIPGDRNGEISGKLIVSYFAVDSILTSTDSLFEYTGTPLRVLTPPYSDTYEDENIDITDAIKSNLGKVVYFMISREFELNSNWASGCQAQNGVDIQPHFLDYYGEDPRWRDENTYYGGKALGSLTGPPVTYNLFLFEIEIK